MTVGVHGSTFGGNPLAMAVGQKALSLINTPETLNNVAEIAGYLKQQLAGLQARFPDVIVDVRGKGLLIGVKLVPNNREFMALARDTQQLLIAGGGDNCVRLLPPLNLTLDEAREAIARFEGACEAGARDAGGMRFPLPLGEGLSLAERSDASRRKGEGRTSPAKTEPSPFRASPSACGSRALKPSPNGRGWRMQ